MGLQATLEPAVMRKAMPWRRLWVPAEWGTDGSASGWGVEPGEGRSLGRPTGEKEKRRGWSGARDAIAEIEREGGRGTPRTQSLTSPSRC